MQNVGTCKTPTKNWKSKKRQVLFLLCSHFLQTPQQTNFAKNMNLLSSSKFPFCLSVFHFIVFSFHLSILLLFPFHLFLSLSFSLSFLFSFSLEYMLYFFNRSLIVYLSMNYQASFSRQYSQITVLQQPVKVSDVEVALIEVTNRLCTGGRLYTRKSVVQGREPRLWSWNSLLEKDCVGSKIKRWIIQTFPADMVVASAPKRLASWRPQIRNEGWDACSNQLQDLTLQTSKKVFFIFFFFFLI